MAPSEYRHRVLSEHPLIAHNLGPEIADFSYARSMVLGRRKRLAHCYRSLRRRCPALRRRRIPQEPSPTRSLELAHGVSLGLAPNSGLCIPSATLFVAWGQREAEAGSVSVRRRSISGSSIRKQRPPYGWRNDFLAMRHWSPRPQFTGYPWQSRPPKPPRSIDFEAPSANRTRPKVPCELH